MNQKQIAALWIKEGGNPAKADEASAVAMAESGGNTTAHTPGSCCYGLYQFHQDYFPVKCAKEAGCATRMAIKLSANGTSWEGGKWEAHENGAYLKYVGKSGFPADKAGAEAKMKGLIKSGQGGFLSGALGEDSAIGGPINAVGDAVTNPLDGIEKLAASVEAIARLIENLFTAHFWVRFGKGLLGAVMVLYAMSGIFKATLGIDLPIGPIASKMKLA